MAKGRAASEPEAMKAVQNALQPLSDEGRARVLRWAVDFFSVKAVPAGQPVPTPGTPAPPTTPVGTDVKIDKFVTSKRPNDTYERLACLAYYIDEREGKTEVKGRDLTKANTDAKQQRVSNISSFLDLAVRRHGFFAPVGKGRKQLTWRGRAVVEALPDRAAVAQALIDHPLSKRRRGGKGKKAKKGS